MRLARLRVLRRPIARPDRVVDARRSVRGDIQLIGILPSDVDRLKQTWDRLNGGLNRAGGVGPELTQRQPRCKIAKAVLTPESIPVAALTQYSMLMVAVAIAFSCRLRC